MSNNEQNFSEWIKGIKIQTYERVCIRDDPELLIEYEEEFKRIGKQIRKAIENEDFVTLLKLNYPDNLTNPLKDMYTRIKLLDVLDKHVRYGYNYSPAHVNELNANSKNKILTDK
jgi:hypothetical protein